VALFITLIIAYIKGYTKVIHNKQSFVYCRI